jgi:chaperonin GroEL
MNIIKGKEAIEGMMSSINEVVEFIKPTYGSGGSNIIIESNLNPKHIIANDCWTIIKDLKADYPAQRIALDFLKELISRQDKLSGDSRKTTLLLLNEILKEGYKADINKLELKRELDKLIPFIESEIDKQTKEIIVDEVENVATTASESKEIGKLLQEIYQKIGKNGIIQVEGSGTFDTSYRFIDGVRFDMTGYLSSSFANTGTQAVYEKPLILVTKKKITTDDDINPLLREMLDMQERRPLIIFTQDMDINVASMLVDLHKSGKLNVCIIKAPTLWRDYVFEDFAKCVGATIIEDSTGKHFKNMHLSDLGTCDKIIIDTDETILIGTKDISEHIAHLQAKGDNDSQLRLSWLTTKTAILKLGANSETDLSYKLLKTRDAIRSSELALKYGVVQGGGICLWRIANDMGNELWKSETGKMMTLVLSIPLKQIMQNMRLDESDFNKISENIVDASMVIKMAVRNSLGIASTILTAQGIVYIQDKTPQEIALELNQKQYDF